MNISVQNMIFGLFALSSMLDGCGEVNTLQLEIKPSQAEYTAVKKVFVTVGCGRGGCHLTTTGDFKVDPDADSPVDLDVEYQMAKRFVNLDAPDESLLIKVALKGDPAAASHSLCFENADACGYRKVDAWLRSSGVDDPSIDDIDCNPIEGACSLVRQ